MVKLDLNPVFLILIINLTPKIVIQAKNINQDEVTFEANPEDFESSEDYEPYLEGDIYGENFENPEEDGPYLEGDIYGETVEHLRNAIDSDSYKWPNGLIPYKIQGTFNSRELDIIDHAINECHTKTCVRFRKRQKQLDYVVITNKNKGCWSSVGRIGGAQEINLQSGKCFSNNGSTIHELMHAMGFYHEQNRSDRDFYITVAHENVKCDMLPYFRKLPFSRNAGLGVRYDYASIMHYKSTTFSKNGKPTLLASKSTPDVLKMGQRIGFSTGDIRKINKMYNCS